MIAAPAIMTTYGRPEPVLGTAQLGLPYGAASRSGMADEAEAERILRTAVERGVRCLDTARAYGESEARIGRLLPRPVRRELTIVTKLSPLAELGRTPASADVERAVTASVTSSLAALDAERLDVLLLHRAVHRVAFAGAVWDTLHRLCARGLIDRLGVSVASPAELSRSLRDPAIRHVQMPFNLLDWRWREAGTDRLLARRPEVVVHLRSPMLQGILASDDPATWPALPEVDPAVYLARLAAAARDLGRRDAVDLCLAYARSASWAAGVVVGTHTSAQLADILASVERPPLAAAEAEMLARSLPPAPQSLLDPSRWPRRRSASPAPDRAGVPGQRRHGGLAARRPRADGAIRHALALLETLLAEADDGASWLRDFEELERWWRERHDGALAELAVRPGLAARHLHLAALAACAGMARNDAGAAAALVAQPDLVAAVEAARREAPGSGLLCQLAALLPMPWGAATGGGHGEVLVVCEGSLAPQICRDYLGAIAAFEPGPIGVGFDALSLTARDRFTRDFAACGLGERVTVMDLINDFVSAYTPHAFALAKLSGAIADAVMEDPDNAAALGGASDGLCEAARRLLDQLLFNHLRSLSALELVLGDRPWRKIYLLLGAKTLLPKLLLLAGNGRIPAGCDLRILSLAPTAAARARAVAEVARASEVARRRAAAGAGPPRRPAERIVLAAKARQVYRVDPPALGRLARRLASSADQPLLILASLPASRTTVPVIDAITAGMRQRMPILLLDSRVPGSEEVPLPGDGRILPIKISDLMRQETEGADAAASLVLPLGGAVLDDALARLGWRDLSGLKEPIASAVARWHAVHLPWLAAIEQAAGAIFATLAKRSCVLLGFPGFILHVRMVLHAARCAGVACADLQATMWAHTPLTDIDIPADHVLMMDSWSGADKSRRVGAPPGKFVTMGSIRLDAERDLPVTPLARSAPGQRQIVFASQPVQGEEMEAAIGVVLAFLRGCPDVDLVVRLHPSDPKMRLGWFARLADRAGVAARVRVLDEGSTLQIGRGADLVVSLSSNLCLECSVLGTPACLIHLVDRPPPIAYDEMGICPIFYREEEALQGMAEMLDRGPAWHRWQERRAAFLGDNPRLAHGGAAAFAAEFLTALARPPRPPGPASRRCSPG